MGYINIKGGIPLRGDIKISGAKNSALPIIAACTAASGIVVLYNVPNILDVHIMLKIIQAYGAVTEIHHNNDVNNSISVVINCSNLNPNATPVHLANKIRTSCLMLGPILGRFGKASIGHPGGCKIGHRPIDLHISALQQLGAHITIHDDIVEAHADGGLKGGEVIFENISVGATENTIMAAVLADGKTTIYNAAIEPEIHDLIAFMTKLGAKIDINADTRTIIIQGVTELHGEQHSILPDRIEAGTYALAAIMTDGKLTLHGINPTQMGYVYQYLQQIGGTLQSQGNLITVSRTNTIRSVDFKTAPFPGLPSDLQAPFMSAMCVAQGTATIQENIFENRMLHVPELRKMGAKIDTPTSQLAIVVGAHLRGNTVSATDLRASAALVLAAFTTKDTSTIMDAQHIHRGYSNFITSLQSCGANIREHA